MSVKSLRISEEIVDHVRQVIGNNTECVWDESRNGADWVYNEVSFALSIFDFLKDYEMNFDNFVLTDNLYTVSMFQEQLAMLPYMLLMYIKFVVVDLKGTSNGNMFKLRDWLQHL